MEDLKNFIANWQIDAEKYAAQHNSGLGFRYRKEGFDGKPAIELKNYIAWFRQQQSMGKNAEQCQEYRAELEEQFMSILHQIIKL